ncbi:hypothetical protein ElyMa_003121400 [Elysia marginata]|uniref:Uncharacterized protein n=1 Tax=Elysia marginata TaxID=1093978 RepID=A0AAV4IUX9_9GAST|nr:hypothetical protein ElyMa_003121400 [Elysia marginata]
MPTTTTKSIQVWGSSQRQSHGGPSGSLPSGGAQGSTISTTTQSPGFLPGDSCNPAYLSLVLLQVGDIETNPGLSWPCSV